MTPRTRLVALAAAAACAVLLAGASGAQPQDVTSRTVVEVGGLRWNRHTDTFDGLITVRNVSAQPIGGPLALALRDITAAAVEVANRAGATANGDALVRLVSGPLAPGARAGPVVVRFANPARERFAFATAVHATAVVPAIAGLSQDAAMQALANAGLVAGAVTRSYSDLAPFGAVIDQALAAGSTANGGSSVDLVVSLGPPPAIAAVQGAVPQEPVHAHGLAAAASVHGTSAGAPTFLQSGEKQILRVDLAIPGRGQIHFAMLRSYRSRLAYDGPLGHGWSFSYGERLYPQPNGDAVRLDSGGHLDRWVRRPDGSYAPPPGFFGTLVAEPDGRFLLREPNGFRCAYDAAGRLVQQRDRFGNAMTFSYDASGNLLAAVDPFGRTIEFDFDERAGRDRLIAIRDWLGREARYEYDARGDLVGVRTPVVAGTSTDNDFPAGRTERYAYAADSAHPDLDHNLISLTRPQEVADGGPAALRLVYGSDPEDPLRLDRVLEETAGGVNASGVAAGGTTRFAYAMRNEGEPSGQPGLTRLEVTIDERNGNTLVVELDERGHEVARRRPTRGLRPDEPPAFEETLAYDADGQLLRRVAPLGNEIRFAYDAGGPRAAQGNLIETREVADTPRGGGEDLVRTFAYEPLYQQLAAATDPRGNAASFEPPIGTASAARYTSTRRFDYQESSGPVAEALEFDIDLSGVTRGLGDLNGDGRTDQLLGLPVRVDAPSVVLLPGSHEAARIGSTQQPVVVELAWNDAGQLRRVIDAEGNVADYAYFPASDPDGDGVPGPGSGDAELTGYLASLTRDAAASPRRSASVPPAALATRLRYDAVGNVIAVVDPRGVETRFEVTALDETVAVTRGADVALAVAAGELVTGEPAFAYVTRRHLDHNGRVVRVEVENRDGDTPGVGDFVDHAYTWNILDDLVRWTGELDADRTAIHEQAYDAEQLPTALTLPEGNRHATSYDERNLPFRHTRGDGSPDAATVQLDYDANANLACVIDAEDSDGAGGPEASCTAYDGFDRPVRITDALGNRAELAYDAAGMLVHERLLGHPAGRPEAPAVRLAERFLRHDELGRVFQIDEALFLADGFAPSRGVDLRDDDMDGFVTARLEYDALSRPTHVVEDDGGVRRIAYDGADRIHETVDALGNRQSFSYDRGSNPLRMRNHEISEDGLVPAEDHEARYTWDQLGRLVRVAADHALRWSYDSRDNIVAYSDAQGPMGSDALGVVPGPINTIGNVARYQHDGRGLVLAEHRERRQTGQGGAPLDLSNPFDPDGRVTVRHLWDLNGRHVGTLDDAGNLAAVAFDALDRPVELQNADGTVHVVRYDRDDNVVETSDPNGTLTQLAHDAIDRVTAQTITPGAGVIGTSVRRFGYDGLSRLTRAEDQGDATHVVERVYDSLSRLLEERQDGAVVSSTYSGDGRRLSLTYPDGRALAFTHDALDRVREIRDGAELVARHDWMGPGARLLRREHGNGTLLSFLDDGGGAAGFDGFQRVTRLRHLAGGTPIVDRRYVYGRMGQRLREERLETVNEADRFRYDSLYRLVGTSYDEGAAAPRDLRRASYVYDGVGNRREVTQVRSGGQSTEVHAVNEMNEYVQVGGVARLHDENGNLTDDGRFRYAYDASDRLVAVSRAADDALVARYEYDALDRRVAKMILDPDAPAEPGVTTRFRLDGWQEIEERGAGGTEATHVHGVGVEQPIQLETTAAAPAGPGTYYLHGDARGDVVAVTDGGGDVVERTLFEDFGRPSAASAIGNPWGFRGRRLDPETGLYDFLMRHYDPLHGRFLQRDALADPANAGNAYTIAGNGPLSNGGASAPAAESTAEIALQEWRHFDVKGPSLTAAAGALYGIGESLLGGIMDLTSIVVAPVVETLGADEESVWGGYAIQRRNALAEGLVAVSGDASLVFRAPLEQFEHAIATGDEFGAGQVFGQTTFDLYQAGRGLPATARKAASGARRLVVSGGRYVSKTMQRAARLATIRTVRRLDGEAAARAPAALAKNPWADELVAAHGGTTGTMTTTPSNVELRMHAATGRPVTDKRAFRVVTGAEPPGFVVPPSTRVPDLSLSPALEKVSFWSIARGMGWRGIEAPQTLGELLADVSQRAAPGRTVVLDLIACRGWCAGRIAKPVMDWGGIGRIGTAAGEGLLRASWMTVLLADNGAPSPDSDGDGIPDTIDSCIDSPSGSAVTSLGCAQNGIAGPGLEYLCNDPDPSRCAVGPFGGTCEDCAIASATQRCSCLGRAPCTCTVSPDGMISGDGAELSSGELSGDCTEASCGFDEQGAYRCVGPPQGCRVAIGEEGSEEQEQFACPADIGCRMIVDPAVQIVPATLAELRKQTTSPDADGTFPFRLAAPASETPGETREYQENISTQGGVGTEAIVLVLGAFGAQDAILEEQVPVGWENVEIECADGATPPPARVFDSAGDDVACTWLDHREGPFTVLASPVEGIEALAPIDLDWTGLTPGSYFGAMGAGGFAVLRENGQLIESRSATGGSIGTNLVNGLFLNAPGTPLDLLYVFGPTLRFGGVITEWTGSNYGALGITGGASDATYVDGDPARAGIAVAGGVASRLDVSGGSLAVSFLNASNAFFGTAATTAFATSSSPWLLVGAANGNLYVHDSSSPFATGQLFATTGADVRTVRCIPNPAIPGHWICAAPSFAEDTVALVEWNSASEASVFATVTTGDRPIVAALRPLGTQVEVVTADFGADGATRILIDPAALVVVQSGSLENLPCGSPSYVLDVGDTRVFGCHATDALVLMPLE